MRYDELKHYGIKGMQWGVRNEEKPNERFKSREKHIVGNAKEDSMEIRGNGINWNLPKQEVKDYATRVKELNKLDFTKLSDEDLDQITGIIGQDLYDVEQELSQIEDKYSKIKTAFGENFDRLYGQIQHNRQFMALEKRAVDLYASKKVYELVKKKAVDEYYRRNPNQKDDSVLTLTKSRNYEPEKLDKESVSKFLFENSKNLSASHNAFETDTPYNTLKHYGILGMKWGVRRFQNKDGSLTKAGEKRYNSGFKKVKAKDVSKRAQHLVSESDLTKAKQHSENANKLADELADDYKKYYKSLSDSDEFKNRMWKNLHDEFGESTPDEADFEWSVMENVDTVTSDMLPENISAKQKKMFSDLDAYYEEAASIAKKLTDEYGDAVIKDDLLGNTKVSAAAERYVLGNFPEASSNSFLYRHFQDYWVNDVEERYALENLFSVDEYKNKFGSNSISHVDELKHYGILGMKWGVRRFQNEDGTLTEAGKRRYETAAKKAERDEERAEKKAQKALDRYNRNHEKALKAEKPSDVAKYSKYLTNEELQWRIDRTKKERELTSMYSDQRNTRNFDANKALGQAAMTALQGLGEGGKDIVKSATIYVGKQAIKNLYGENVAKEIFPKKDNQQQNNKTS